MSAGSSAVLPARGASNAAALRELLAERFPEAKRPGAGALPTGVPALDEALGGGLPVGRLTEVVSAAPSGGGQLVLAQVLATTRARRGRAALVDADEGFDPAALAGECLRHLVWVRGRGLLRALQAAELLIRDGNFALVALDLRGVPAGEWRRVPPTAWYRLQRAAEPGEAAVLVQTGEARVPAAAYRLILTRSFGLAALEETRGELARRLEPELVRDAAHRLAKAG
jgi:hypothetical protein